MKIPNYLSGSWQTGSGDGEALFDPVRGEELVRVSTSGLDFSAALRFARSAGGPALRELTYSQRAALLGRIADTLTAQRDSYYQIALENSGSPKSDAAIDVDGAIYTLKYYAKEGSRLENALLHDGELVRLSKEESFQALHLCVPVSGVAILINAFNFPAWGLWEKAAVALLSGVPVFVKPATPTAWLAQRMVEDVVKAGTLPTGALSIACGRAGDLLEHVGPSDVIAFTGSASTAAAITAIPQVQRHVRRLNIEADSLNSALLGPDVEAGAPEVELFIREVVREMTVKAGQKCTAIRRILVPAERLDEIGTAISERLARVRMGDPRSAEIQMGPVVNKAQQTAVNNGIKLLCGEARYFDGSVQSLKPFGADEKLSSFVAPTLLTHNCPLEGRAIHEIEVFGPVATLLPYASFDDALTIASLGQGSLVASVFTQDSAIAQQAARVLAPTHGRVHIVSAEVGKVQTGHGNVMPMSVHGGPGRAGGGQELGGLRALRLYSQLAAIQAPTEWLRSLIGQSTLLRP